MIARKATSRTMKGSDRKKEELLWTAYERRSYPCSLAPPVRLGSARAACWTMGCDDGVRLCTSATQANLGLFIQGMNDVLSMILMVMDDEANAYSCFANYMATIQADFMATGMMRKLGERHIFVFAVLCHSCSFRLPCCALC